MTEMIVNGAGTGNSCFAQNDQYAPVPRKRRRTPEDFYLFCKIVLEYENYEETREEPEEKRAKHSQTSYSSNSMEDGSAFVHSFPTEVANECTISHTVDNILGLDSENADYYNHHSRLNTSTISSGSSAEEEASSASTQDWMQKGIQFLDEKAFDEITCFCNRPYAGRPMIECTMCLTWMHLSCAKIKKSNIPKEFFCSNCKKNMKNKNSGNNQPPRTTSLKQMKKKSGDGNSYKQ